MNNICFISKNPCLIYKDDKIENNKEHTYFDQIEMQLAITTRIWPDFIFYTSKGMVIDRVIFGENHWKNFRENILNFLL